MAARERISGQRIGMLATAFLMVALIGVFSTYAAPIPAIRGVIVEAAIARAAAGNNPAAMQAALSETKPLLGTAGRKTLATLSPDRAGLTQAATLLNQASLHASVVISYRLRLMVIVIGVLAGLFGIAVLGIRDSAPSPTIMRTDSP